MSISLGLGLGMPFASPAASGSSPVISSINGPGSDANFEGWSATWASGTPSVPDPDGVSALTLSATQQGFDGTATGSTLNAVSINDTYVITSRIRQLYPNQGTLPSAPNWTSDQVALNEYAYSTTTIAGVTNNSTLTSPKPIANWTMFARQVVGNSLYLEVTCWHRNARNRREAAAVKFIVTDGASGTVNQIVTTTAVRGLATDQLACVVYSATIDITTLATGLITANAEVYPWFGADNATYANSSVLKSAQSAVRREFSPRYFLKDTTLSASPYYAYVAAAADAPNGIGTPVSGGAVSTTLATAKATPFDTIAHAIDGINTARGASGLDGCIIMVGQGTFSLGTRSVNTTQKVAALKLTRDTTFLRTACIVTVGAGSVSNRMRIGSSLAFTSPVATGAVWFDDLTVNRASSSFIQGEATALLDVFFSNCNMDGNSLGTTWFSNASGWLNGVPTTSNFTGLSGQWFMLQGMVIDLQNGSMEHWLNIGNKITRPGALSSTSALGLNGAIFAFNKVVKVFTNTSQMFAIDQTGGVSQVAWGQNEFEYAFNQDNPILKIEADAANNPSTHVVVHDNTFAGWQGYGRNNLLYDWNGTARSQKLHSLIGNAHVQIDTKGDVLMADGTRTGNQAYYYGVGCQGEFSQYAVSSVSGEAQLYGGLGASINITSTTVQNDPLFTSYQGTVAGGTSGAGGGTYTVGNGSPLKSRNNRPVLSHDAGGNARPSSADTTGAWL